MTPDDAGAIPARPAPRATARLDEMEGRVGQATALLKALGHDGRLLILCHLAERERSVGELESLLGRRQATVSQQLARLREDGLVSCRVEGKSRVYRMSDPKAARVVELLHQMFCGD